MYMQENQAWFEGSSFPMPWVYCIVLESLSNVWYWASRTTFKGSQGMWSIDDGP